MFKRGNQVLLLAALSLALAGTAPAPAQAPETTAPAAETPLAPPADTSQDASARIDAEKALNEIEKSITLSKDKRDALKREIEELTGDRAKQNAALIAAGQRVKLAEIEVAAMEERLDNLIVAELEVRGRLDGADQNIANVLAALERISRNPPPALIVNPNDALGSARSAILISAILPQLREKADTVMADLRELQRIKSEAQAEEERLKANFAILEEEQLRIATLILARQQGVQSLSAELEEEERQAAELAAKATSLKELVGVLADRVNAVAEAARASEAAQAGQAPGALSPETIRLALANSARKEPAVPFAAAFGYLTLPASGVNVLDYGAGDGFGGISQGLSMVTRPAAQVVAPADGWVMYKGPYLNYGQIVILNPGQDYTILLAGLETTSVEIGQFVLMGEPLGTMGSQTSGRTLATSAGVSRPTLYIELRKNNEPVDPTGWWANPSNQTQSG